MSGDLEDIRAQAEASVGLVRKLIASWLPEASAEEKAEQSAPVQRSVTDLYTTDPIQAQRTMQLKKKIVGTKTSSATSEGAENSAVPSNSRGASSKPKPIVKKKDEDDDEEAVLHKISSSSKTIKKPTDILSSYLDKDRPGKKKKRKKNKNQGGNSGPFADPS